MVLDHAVPCKQYGDRIDSDEFQMNRRIRIRKSKIKFLFSISFGLHGWRLHIPDVQADFYHVQSNHDP